MNVNEFSANIQYKNSFITECTITKELVDGTGEAQLIHSEERLIPVHNTKNKIVQTPESA